MTRALVLGGGGPVGVAWESGLAVGFAEAGVALGAADLVVGTSAGSIVGARLTLGLDLAETVRAVGQPLPVEAGAAGTIDDLMNALAGSASLAQTAEQMRSELGKLALGAQTLAEADFAGAAVFAQLAGHNWPASFRCTAIDTRTGELKVWDAAAGAPLDRAVASSCSVPMVFPPVTINGARYMDGGMRTPLNADLAAGHDAVIVVSCLPTALPDGITDPMFEATAAQVESELAVLRDGGAAVEIIGPGEEFLEVSGWGAELMNPSRAAGAYEAGVRQAAAEADRLLAIWTA
ncbi:MAG: patatin-like phospholipase family protein [Nocardiopsaceae bacterium]|nr:patatin-like phospholipase family protein [Nocardiopsaceae bacterium]